MSSILPDEGAYAMLGKMLSGTLPSDYDPNLTLHLFCNDVTLDVSNTSSDFTIADGGGYASITIPAYGGWTAEIGDDGIPVVYAATQAFTFTGALDTNTTVYGYVVTDTDGTPFFAEKFDSTVTPAEGGVLLVTPKFQLSYGTPNGETYGIMVPDEGAVVWLSNIFNYDWYDLGLQLRLFCNDITPTADDTLEAYTEASGGDYAAIDLTDINWSIETTSESMRGAYAEQTFTFTSALDTNTTVYGYFITNADDVVFIAQRLDSAYTPAADGTLSISPVVAMSDGTPTD